MQVVQAVFQVFHHFELAQQLRQRGYLRKIYSTWPWARIKREGIPRQFVGTFPWFHTPDYFFKSLRFYPKPVSNLLNQLSSLTFDEYTLRDIPPCDAFIGISGAGLKTGQLVQQRGGRFICDRGSTHQRFQENILRAEYLRWQVPLPPETPHIAIREEKIYEVADAITVPSSAARRSFIQMGQPPEKIHVIPYGVRLDRFRRNQPPPEGRFEVLFAGQVALRKGIPHLLMAFARLQHPRKRLTLVGTVQEHIRPLLRNLPLANVDIRGALPQPELVDLMGRSHVLVLPSIEEGLALVQAQAMACECPIIATEATGAEDLFTDGVEGFIVKNDDLDALSERLQILADDEPRRQQMSAAALERVRSIGGWETYGDRWESLLHQITGVR